MTEISQEAIELVVQAIHDEMPVPLERGPRPNEVRLGVAKALPAIRNRWEQEVRERLETLRQWQFGEFDGPWLKRSDVLAIFGEAELVEEESE